MSLDTETTGFDLYHGARPFFVTTAFEDGTQKFWGPETGWLIDPVTRGIDAPLNDLREIKELIDQADVIVTQNGKFDVHALVSIGAVEWDEWPWEKTQDTLTSGHILASNQPHNLTDMAITYLGRRADIQRHEDELEACVKLARNHVRAHIPSWRIAKRGEADMPSVKEKAWKQDSWLPRLLAAELGWPSDNRFWSVLRDYANADSAVTLALWMTMEVLLKKKDLWMMHQERMKVLRANFELEHRGLTGSVERTRCRREEFTAESRRCRRICVNIAREHVDVPEWYPGFVSALGVSPDTPPGIAADWADEHGKPKVAERLRSLQGCNLVLPKSGNNKSLTDFCFNKLKLPPVKRTDKGNPSLDKSVLEYWEYTLDVDSKEHLFISSLIRDRRFSTALSFIDSYERFWLPKCWTGCEECGGTGCWSCTTDFVIHPNTNPTGTDTLRGSMNNPNGQQISKLEIANLRYCFGPAPGREWWSLDARNIERRIPAYEADEKEIIALLERPDDPPYYGSEHALVAHLIYPKEFEECRDDHGGLDGRVFKKRHAATLYQWAKNFNFAVQYGCQQRKADATAKREGAYNLVKRRFAKQEHLNQYWINFANRRGYVETIPDRSINPRRGYPLFCSRSESGWVLPTVPLNYHVSGTACWAVGTRWKNDAHALLQEWRRADPRFDGYICLEVHDELVLDMPKRDPFDAFGKPLADPKMSNLWRARAVQRLLEKIGDDLGIPLTSGCEYHQESWAEGVSL